MAVRVHDAECLVRDRGAGTGEQAVLELEQRWFYPRVAVRSKDRHDGLDRRGLGFRLGRKQVAQAGRQERRVGGGEVIHGRRGYSTEVAPSKAQGVMRALVAFVCLSE